MNNSKGIIWICVVIGSTIGSSVPLLWHAGWLSYSSVLGSGIGGLLGIWVGYKLMQNF